MYNLSMMYKDSNGDIVELTEQFIPGEVMEYLHAKENARMKEKAPKITKYIKEKKYDKEWLDKWKKNPPAVHFKGKDWAIKE